VEIILGWERRRWSTDRKRAIVAETIAAGGVARVARRHGANPAMVFAWRKQFGASIVEASRAPAFVPIEVIAPPAASHSVCSAPPAPSPLIEVEIGADIRLRIKSGAEPALAAAVARALRG
jgi:transposase-like protein